VGTYIFIAVAIINIIIFIKNLHTYHNEMWFEKIFTLVLHILPPFSVCMFFVYLTRRLVKRYPFIKF
jgi:hypothetical protein